MASESSSGSSSDGEETPNTGITRASASASPAIPSTVISQRTTRNGATICQPTCSVNKINIDVTVPKDVRPVQCLAYSIIEHYGNNPRKIGKLLDIMRNFINEDQIAMVPDNNDTDWPKELVNFIDALQAYCEHQINSSLSRIKAYFDDFISDVHSACVSCIEILITFKTKESRLKFIQHLLCEDISKKIAEMLFHQEFCSKLTTIVDDLKTTDGRPLDEEQKITLQSFLEQVSDIMAINIYFRVDQLFKADDTDDQKFQFAISAAKVLRPNFDTHISDMTAITHQMDAYLAQEPIVHKTFRQALSAPFTRMLTGSSAVENRSADNFPAGDPKPKARKFTE